MNSNRGNNRRRGRGNNNRQQGHQQLNRIDSRARGNAPQLLEKYRKLAHDAHLNGDRVTEETYLQYADHYFRVLADQKTRQDESRQPRRDDRSSDGDDSYGSQNYDSSGSGNDGPYDSAGRSSSNGRYYEDRDDDTPSESANADSSDSNEFEPAENPFVRENRPPRDAAKAPRKPRRRARSDQDGEAESDASAPEGAERPADRTEAGKRDADKRETGKREAGLDPASLPPAIAARSDGESGDQGSGADAETEAEAKPKRRRTRRATPPAEDGGEALEAVN